MHGEKSGITGFCKVRKRLIAKLGTKFEDFSHSEEKLCGPMLDEIS